MTENPTPTGYDEFVDRLVAYLTNGHLDSRIGDIRTALNRRCTTLSIEMDQT